MSKSVSHYLRDYLKLTGSAKFSLMGGKPLTAAEQAAPEVTFQKFVKLLPAPGPNNVFKHTLKEKADFDASASLKTEYTNYDDFVAHFKEVQRELVTLLIAKSDAEEAKALAAAAAPAAASSAPLMGGRRSKQYGGLSAAAKDALEIAASAAGVIAGIVDVSAAVNYIISLIEDTKKLDTMDTAVFLSTMKNVLEFSYDNFEIALQARYKAISDPAKANNASDVANEVFNQKGTIGSGVIGLDDLPNTIFELRPL